MAANPIMKKCEWGKGTDVDDEFPEIRVELTRKTETSGHTRHDCGNKVVEISISRGIEFEGPSADIVQCLIVNTECLIRVFRKLLYNQQ